MISGGASTVISCGKHEREAHSTLVHDMIVGAKQMSYGVVVWKKVSEEIKNSLLNELSISVN